MVLIYAGMLIYLGLTMYLANQEQLDDPPERSIARMLLFVVPGLLGLLGLYILMIWMVDATIDPETAAAQGLEKLNMTTTAALTGIVISLIGAFAVYQFITSETLRLGFKRLLGETASYQPASIVHMTAVVFSAFLLVVNTALFLLDGGTSGMAENIETGGVSSSFTIFQAVLWVLAAFLGVGYAIRRTFPASLVRLGLRAPTREDITWAFGIVALLFVFLMVFGGILTLLFSEEQLAEQNRAARSLADAFSTFSLALLLATCAAVGEEIFFRGALQPVFGLWPTSIFFALIHSQVLLSPGLIGLLAVALAFGWLRRRQSTTAAIIAHFVYNLTVLLINIAGSGVIV